MGVSNTIQFRGKQQVLQAYQNREVDVWSVFAGKTLLTKGTGFDELNDFLSMVEKNQSEATYILKVYEDITDPKKVKEKTEADGSFYFRLVEPEIYEQRRYGFMQEYDARLTAMDEKFNMILERLEQPAESNEESGSIGSIITGILSDPDKLEKTIGVVKNLLGIGQAPQYPAQIGNVSILDSGNQFLSPSYNAAMSSTQQQQEQQQPLSETEKLTRLAAAIDTLEKCDNNLVPHLEKLAKIASTNPAQFKTLIGMLDVF